MAEVEVTPASPEACGSCGGCEEQPKGPVLFVDADERMAPGRRVKIEVPEGGELGPAVVVFFLPVLALVVGAILGSRIPAWTSAESGNSTGYALLGALVLLAPALIVVRIADRRRARAGSGPRIISIER
jgi:sigma-E factor negative regulatory protein RseC